MHLTRYKALIIALSFSSFAHAETAVPSLGDGIVDAAQKPTVAEMVKLKQNPVSGLRQIVFQSNANPNYPESGKNLSINSLQVVWPFSINDDYRLVTYTIVPQYHIPALSGQNAEHGLGNTLVNLFVSPKEAGSFVWGLGPTALLPTRNNPALGSSNVALGPAALLFFPQTNWSAGLVLQNAWSLGSGTGVDKVNAMGAQYLFSYNLPDGWSLYSNATISANWTKEQSERWTVPVGGGVGKLFYVGPLPISLSLQAFRNVVTPTGGPTWSANLQLAFLFGAPQQ